MKISIGDIIRFPLDTWDNKDKHSIIYIESTVLDICQDPMKVQENKYGVQVNNDQYGIPLSEIIDVIPSEGTQLSLIM